MTEQITPDLGALPWKPQRGMKMVRELNRWDVPTAGILRNWRGHYQLFRCLDGASGQYSVWAYIELTRAEARGLMALEGEELRQRQAELMVGRTLSLAVAEENAGIIHRFTGRLKQSEPEPRLDPAVGQRVQDEIEGEASALRGMPIFAC
ncbi:hypothetical protein [Streptomyces sp. bgisy034]|uniref:hypothetical protein n=1 Tax=Streptomyces sp. bgisy034 TaxID=3413774 RepID=UPI003EC062FF